MPELAAHLERVARARELVKVWLWDDEGTPLEQHERVIENIAAALAACAREAKLEEANWWANENYHGTHMRYTNCPSCDRLNALERAVGEKA